MSIDRHQFKKSFLEVLQSKKAQKHDAYFFDKWTIDGFGK
jgi:hypothetical protein